METNELNLDRFNPTKAELLSLAEEGRKLIINGIDDKIGYTVVHEYRMKLKESRVKITKTGKEAREEALAFQKKVIAYEKELIGIIEPIEAELHAKEKAIDDEKARIERQALLPSRIEKLKEIDITMSEEELMDLDVDQFAEAEWIDKKEAKVREQEAAIEAEKKRLAEEAKIEEARKAAEKEAQDKAREDAEIAKTKAEADAEAAKVRAEEEKAAAVKAEQEKAEAEKQALIKEQEEKEAARVAEEARIKAEADAKAKAQMEEQAKLEAEKKYQDFLAKNEYNETDFRIERDGNKVTLFKKVDEIII